MASSPTFSRFPSGETAQTTKLFIAAPNVAGGGKFLISMLILETVASRFKSVFPECGSDTVTLFLGKVRTTTFVVWAGISSSNRLNDSVASIADCTSPQQAAEKSNGAHCSRAV